MDDQNRGTKRKFEEDIAKMREWCQAQGEYVVIPLCSSNESQIDLFSNSLGQRRLNGLGMKYWNAIQLMAEEFRNDAFRATIMNFLSRNDFKNGVRCFNHFLKLFDDFNKLMMNPPTQGGIVSRPLLRFILEASYSNAISEPGSDHSYEPFDDKTFEETVDMIEQVVELCNISDEDTFVNLGSGIGSVVMAVAALTKCSNVYGIEMDETANKRAKKMEYLFQSWLDLFGKTCAPFKLMEGDFFAPNFQDTLRNSKTILVNNSGFSSRIEQGLRTIFSEMPTDTRIILTQPFVSSSPIYSNRGLSTIDFIQKIYPRLTSESSTNKNKAFFFYVVDRIPREGNFTRNKHHQPLTSNQKSLIYESDEVNNQMLIDLSKKTNGKLYIDGHTNEELVSNDSNCFETQTPISPTLPSSNPETKMLVDNEPSTSREPFQPNLQTAKLSFAIPIGTIKPAQWKRYRSRTDRVQSRTDSETDNESNWDVESTVSDSSSSGNADDEMTSDSD